MRTWLFKTCGWMACPWTETLRFCTVCYISKANRWEVTFIPVFLQ